MLRLVRGAGGALSARNSPGSGSDKCRVLQGSRWEDALLHARETVHSGALRLCCRQPRAALCNAARGLNVGIASVLPCYGAAMKLDRLPRSVLPPAPLATNRPHAFRVHGTTVSDDYAWLKAENWREVLETPATLPGDIRDHLERENAYLAAVLRGTGALRKRLISEMRGRIREDDASVPEPDGPFAYFTRYREGGEYPLICRLPREGGDHSILVDGDLEAEGHAFFDLGEAAHSPDHRWLAWSADLRGSESFTIRVRDLATGRDLPDLVPHTGGDVAWLGDSSGFYYVE